MGAKQKSPISADLTVIGNDPERERGALKHIGGSPSDDWNNRLANLTLQALRFGPEDEAAPDQHANAAIHGLIGIAPRDEMEAMMAAQLLAAHGAALDCYRRAWECEGKVFGLSHNLAMAIKLSNGFTGLLQALNHYRGSETRKVPAAHVPARASSNGALAGPRES